MPLYLFDLCPLSEVHKLAEGLEPPGFWLTLGSQGAHEHFPPASHLPYSPPLLYSVGYVKNSPSFLQLPSTKKDELVSSACHVLAYKDQVMQHYGREGYFCSIIPKGSILY